MTAISRWRSTGFDLRASASPPDQEVVPGPFLGGAGCSRVGLATSLSRTDHSVPTACPLGVSFLHNDEGQRDAQCADQGEAGVHEPAPR